LREWTYFRIKNVYSFGNIEAATYHEAFITYGDDEKMTGPVLILTIIMTIFKLVVTCLPTDVVNWLLNKFKMHPTLSDGNTVITMDGKRLEGEEKNQVIQDVNHAMVLKKNHIFPGNDSLFLQPKSGVKPLVIDTKKGKRDIQLLVFVYGDHVDVVKQDKKKLVAYSMRSESLQERSMMKEMDVKEA
jgi:hypothetical protein